MRTWELTVRGATVPSAASDATVPPLMAPTVQGVAVSAKAGVSAVGPLGPRAPKAAWAPPPQRPAQALLPQRVQPLLATALSAAKSDTADFYPIMSLDLAADAPMFATKMPTSILLSAFAATVAESPIRALKADMEVPPTDTESSGVFPPAINAVFEVPAVTVTAPWQPMDFAVAPLLVPEVDAP